MEKKFQCECGEWTGERCCWTGSVSEMVVVEYMPESLRSSHIAAHNRGVWPHNGSIRVAVERGCAEMAVESGDGWAEIVEGANPLEYAEEAE